MFFQTLKIRNGTHTKGTTIMMTLSQRDKLIEGKASFIEVADGQ